jgi:hypothetical protein
MVSYSANFQKHGAYRIDQATIQQLLRVVKEFTGVSPKITFKLHGDHEIEHTELRELLDDTYVTSKNIAEAEIEGLGREASISIKLCVPEVMDLPIMVRINGDREKCVGARTKLEAIFQGSEEWYSRYMFPRIFGFYLGYIVGVPALILAAIIMVHHLVGQEMLTGDGKIYGWAVLEWFAIWATCFGLKRRMFPKMMFDISRSADLAKSALFWRNLVGTGVAVGLIAAVLGGLIVERVLK